MRKRNRIHKPIQPGPAAVALGRRVELALIEAQQKYLDRIKEDKNQDEK